MPDPKQRFSDRVENYIRYRPSYPPTVLELLRAECCLTQQSVVADIGSGTGILSTLFLENGNRLFGVEPNAEMRAASERLLADHRAFISISGSAEDTTLADASVDVIVAGQSFHWFDRPRARREFQRILKPGGWIVILWNNRLTDATPFLRAYEDLLLRCGTDYAQVDHKNITENVLQEFFQPGEVRLKLLPNEQIFDFDGLRGRALSSSYVPAEPDPKHAPFMRELKAIFEKCNSNGHVAFVYQTQVYYGRLSRPCRLT
jgi:SAM-dependent methyltransferase